MSNQKHLSHPEVKIAPRRIMISQAADCRYLVGANFSLAFTSQTLELSPEEAILDSLAQIRTRDAEWIIYMSHMHDRIIFVAFPPFNIIMLEKLGKRISRSFHKICFISDAILACLTPRKPRTQTSF